MCKFLILNFIFNNSSINKSIGNPLYENNSKSSCINIKYPLNAKYTDTLDCITIDTHKLLNSIPFKIKNNKLFINYKPQLTKIDYNEYLKYETVNKYKQSKKVKEKFHTFLVFQSGAVLQSGCGPEMNEVYNKFINMIVDNRNQIEEVIEKHIKLYYVKLFIKNP